MTYVKYYNQDHVSQFSRFEIGFLVPPGVAVCVYLGYRLTWLSNAGEFRIMKYIFDRCISSL